MEKPTCCQVTSPYLDPIIDSKYNVWNDKEFLYISEFISGRLYFGVLKTKEYEPSSDENVFFFNPKIDAHIPKSGRHSKLVNLSDIHHYCSDLILLLKKNPKKTIVHYVPNEPLQRSISAVLIGCFGILHLNQSFADAYFPLSTSNIPDYEAFKTSDRAADEKSVLTVEHCIRAVSRAQELGMFSFEDFNVEEYEMRRDLKYGNIVWIVPQKFLGFSSPTDVVDFPKSNVPEFYGNYFKSHGVTNIVRLNRKQYDERKFMSMGFVHDSLYMVDGYPPSTDILHKFLKIEMKATGAIAVHCRAGLGRTGTMIACHLIHHYRFGANEAVAWVRMCRPGSINTLQHGWLQVHETMLWKIGESKRIRAGDFTHVPTVKYGLYSKELAAEVDKATRDASTTLALLDPAVRRMVEFRKNCNQFVGAMECSDAYSKITSGKRTSSFRNRIPLSEKKHDKQSTEIPLKEQLALVSGIMSFEEKKPRVNGNKKITAGRDTNVPEAEDENNKNENNQCERSLNCFSVGFRSNTLFTNDTDCNSSVEDE